MDTEVLTSSHSQFWEWALGEQEAAKMDPDQSSPSQVWGEADTRVCLSLFCVAPGSRVVCVSGVCVRDTESVGACAGLQKGGVPPGPWMWRASGFGDQLGLERLDSREVSCPLLFLLAGLWGRHWGPPSRL